MKINSFMRENEARLVAGMEDGRRTTQYELYRYCADYFWDNYRGVFFTDENTAGEILQNSFVALWENIERRRIYARDGMVMGKGNEPLKGSILTYFMSIASNKYKEWVRENPWFTDPETEKTRNTRKNELDPREYVNSLCGSDENIMLEIIADLISDMSPRCYEILTKYYYERKDLDTIMGEILTIGSKDALKTKKHKCLETLRKAANETYRSYLNE